MGLSLVAWFPDLGQSKQVHSVPWIWELIGKWSRCGFHQLRRNWQISALGLRNGSLLPTLPFSFCIYQSMIYLPLYFSSYLPAYLSVIVVIVLIVIYWALTMYQAPCHALTYSISLIFTTAWREKPWSSPSLQIGNLSGRGRSCPMSLLIILHLPVPLTHGKVSNPITVLEFFFFFGNFFAWCSPKLTIMARHSHVPKVG